MRKGKLFILRIVIPAFAFFLTLILVLGFDTYLHKRHEKTFGLNIWGYRGAIVKHKQPGEKRMVILGGSTAFGYGVNPEHAFPAYLERKLNERHYKEKPGPITVVNLAFNNQGAYSFLFTLRDYDYLDYDGAIFYEGYNDLGAVPNKSLFRHDSPIFRLTGYYPIFPLILTEKAMALRYGGDMDAAYRKQDTAFKPNLADRASASALEAGVKITQSLERQLGVLTQKPTLDMTPTSIDCPEPWAHYCQSVYLAADYMLKRNKRVLVVTQPYVSDRHVEQQRFLLNMINNRLIENPNFRYVNLGLSIDLKDKGLAYDGLHLTAQGNEHMANRLLEAVIEVVQ